MKWTLKTSTPQDEAVIVDENGNEILGVSEWIRAEEKDLELMAAAPELLEQLKRLNTLVAILTDKEEGSKVVEELINRIESHDIQH